MILNFLQIFFDMVNIQRNTGRKNNLTTRTTNRFVTYNVNLKGLFSSYFSGQGAEIQTPISHVEILLPETDEILSHSE